VWRGSMPGGHLQHFATRDLYRRRELAVDNDGLLLCAPHGMHLQHAQVHRCHPSPATTQGLPRTEAVQGSRGERHVEVIAPDRRRQPRGGRSGRCGGRRCSRRRRRCRRRRRRSVDAPRAGCRAEQRAEHAEQHQVPRKRGAPPARPWVGHGQRVRMRRGLSRTWRVSTPHGRCSHQSGWPLASGYGLPVPSTANTQDR